MSRNSNQCPLVDKEILLPETLSKVDAFGPNFRKQILDEEMLVVGFGLSPLHRYVSKLSRTSNFRSHQESVYRTCEEFVIESPVLVLVFAQLFEDIVSGDCIHVFGQEVAPKLFERDVLLLSTDVLKRFAQLFFFWFSMLFLNHETS